MTENWRLIVGYAMIWTPTIIAFGYSWRVFGLAYALIALAITCLIVGWFIVAWRLTERP